MTSTPKFLWIIVLVVLAAPGTGYAQGESEDFLSPLKRITRFFEGKDALQQTLSTVNDMEVEFFRKRAGIDKRTAAKLYTIKNPFYPQLPIFQESEAGEIAPVPEPIAEAPAVRTEEEVVRTLEAPVSETVLSPANRFVVSGLIWNSDRPQAIVNGRIVGIGDILPDNWEITHISREGVKVSAHGHAFLIEPKGAKHE